MATVKVSMRSGGLLSAVPKLLLTNCGQVLTRRSGTASLAVQRRWLDKSLAEHTDKEPRL